MDMMDSQSFCIDLIAKNHPTYPMVKAKCGGKSYVVKLPPHRIFSAVQEVIFVESDLNRQCLRLLQEGKLEVAPNKFQQVQEYCVGAFGIEAEVDMASLVMKLFFGQEEDTAEHLTILDKVTFMECASFFNLAYEKLSSRLNNKINRKLRRYISIAKRSASEKSMLQKLYKQCKDIPEQKNEQIVQEKVNVKGRSTVVVFEKSDKPYLEKKKEEGSVQEGKNRKYAQRQKNKKSNDKFYQQKRPVSREKTFDERILLGIKGDSEEGWRQRIRPSRIPPKTQIKTQAFTHKKPEAVIHRQQKKEEQSSKLVKVFEFPLNGNKFDFHCLAKGKKHFMLHINGTFWVKFIDDILTISNNSKGYIRKGSQLDIMENGSGFMAEGLTINLDGLSNMEDGGDGFGDPTVEEIINNNSQWFTIVTMDIYIKQ